jgi:hypothetical protein
MKAYGSKVKSQIEEAAHASPVATVLLDYLEKESTAASTSGSLEKWIGWEGTPTTLFKTLLEHAKTLDISTRQKGWPKAPHVLVRQLNELSPSLKSLGWEIVVSRAGTTRRIGINSVTSVTSVTSVISKDSLQEKLVETVVTRPLIREVLEKVRAQFVEGSAGEWCGFAVEAGLSEKEAESLFESLKGSELFWLDRPDGKAVWRWVR